MKKITLVAVALTSLALTANAQYNYEYAFDNLPLIQNELRGSSRYQSMAGAFGALGGDLSAIVHNPGGIGVYRTGDLGITLSLDFNSSKTGTYSESQTRFRVNNFGYAGAFKLSSETMPNINWSFTYNRLASYDRRYHGVVRNLPTSVTNYIADAMTDNEDATADNMTAKSGFNPFWNGNAPWNQILAYNNYLAIPTNSAGTKFAGLGFDGVTADGEFEVIERGHNDEFAITLGGNLVNTLYWGVGVGINEFLHERTQYYGESLYNTEVYTKPDDASATLVNGNADLGYNNWTRTTGLGYNFKFGIILKPVNEFRFGVAFHTPTFYKMRQRGWTELNTAFAPENGTNYKLSDYSPEYVNDFKLRTPWRFIGSIAGVIGGKGIISADYEYVANTATRVRQWYDDNYYHGDHEIESTTSDIKNYFSPNHIIRVGAEYRINPSWSIRAGYSYQTASASADVRDNKVNVVTSGSATGYAYDRSTQYITAGFGYKYNNFYIDLAYVHKYRLNNYHLFPSYGDLPTVYDEVKDHNNRISASLGFRF